VSDLEEALTLTATSDGGRMAIADPRYEAANGMFGGWTAAILMRAVIESAGSGAEPSAITVNYVEKIEAGTEVIVRSSRVGGGRSLNHWHAEVVAADDERTLAHALVVLSERRVTDGHVEPSMPDAPDPESLEESHPPAPFGDRFVLRPVAGLPPASWLGNARLFGRYQTSSVMWVRDLSGRRVDHLQLVCLSDLNPPRSFFWSVGPRLSATLSLSVYFFATSAELAAVGDDYVLTAAIGTRGVDSISGQQARLWSRRGDLLATTEQLCWYR